MRGTLLNTATVAGGAALGLAAGRAVPESVQPIVMNGLGLVTLGIGASMFLKAKNVLAVVAAVALGGVLGHLLGFTRGLEAFAGWAQSVSGSEDSATFVQAVVSTSVLFCAGPMTLLGCLQDALEKKIELLGVKSAMDGFGAFFFAAALGPGVLVTALVVLVFQSALTLAARPLSPLAEDEALLSEVSGAGGVLMLGIGLGLLQVKALPMADYVPALFLAPAFVALARRFSGKEA